MKVKQSVFVNNDALADESRAGLKEEGMYLLNLMPSPVNVKTGAGSEAVAHWLKEEVRNWKGE